MATESLASKVVVITGASAGVGRATAAAFGRAGAKVALLARGQERLDAAKRELENLGGQVLALSVDVAEADAVFAAAERIEAELGPIDVWINNAMATIFGPVKGISPAEFRRATEVTYLGGVHGTMAALQRMLPRNRGVILQVGSALAYRSVPLQAPYCGAKHALVGFIDSLRSELIHDGSQVKLTMVHLAAFNTPQFDWGRNHMDKRPQPVPPIYQPDVAAEAIIWAARHPRREVWVGGPTYKAILANRIAPALLDRILARKGYDGQITKEPEQPGRPDNLFTPAPGDHGAYGRFSAKARKRSWLLWIRKHIAL